MSLMQRTSVSPVEISDSFNVKTCDFSPVKHLHFTIDCDWVPGSEKGLEALLDCCDRYGMKATVFFTGRFAEAYPTLVRDCHERGHQLGTHGWAHGGLEEDEDFRTAGYEQQRSWIRQATQAVEQAAGVRPVIFRAPNLWIGETTLRILEEEGYLYDSSIPARRFDLGFGRVHYLKYFWAPTQPYRPSEADLGKPGTSVITEIPPSAFLFPVNMATLRVLDRAGIPAPGLLLPSVGIHPRERPVVSEEHVEVEHQGNGSQKLARARSAAGCSLCPTLCAEPPDEQRGHPS
jgi:peptidoglycan/xylan/chitin deacetylase (PgdA/CDA1 family)